MQKSPILSSVHLENRRRLMLQISHVVDQHPEAFWYELWSPTINECGFNYNWSYGQHPLEFCFHLINSCFGGVSILAQKSNGAKHVCKDTKTHQWTVHWFKSAVKSAINWYLRLVLTNRKQTKKRKWDYRNICKHTNTHRAHEYK